MNDVLLCVMLKCVSWRGKYVLNVCVLLMLSVFEVVDCNGVDGGGEVNGSAIIGAGIFFIVFDDLFCGLEGIEWFLCDFFESGR